MNGALYDIFILYNTASQKQQFCLLHRKSQKRIAILLNIFRYYFF